MKNHQPRKTARLNQKARELLGLRRRDGFFMGSVEEVFYIDEQDRQDFSGDDMGVAIRVG